jgi:hypothetical protein
MQDGKWITDALKAIRLNRCESKRDVDPFAAKRSQVDAVGQDLRVGPVRMCSPESRDDPPVGIGRRFRCGRRRLAGRAKNGWQTAGQGRGNPVPARRAGTEWRPLRRYPLAGSQLGLADPRLLKGEVKRSLGGGQRWHGNLLLAADRGRRTRDRVASPDSPCDRFLESVGRLYPRGGAP